MRNHVELCLIKACVYGGKEHQVLANASSEDFPGPLSQVFQAIKKVVDNRQTPDIVTVSEVLEDWGWDSPMSWAADLEAYPFYPENLESYCKQLKQKSLKRKLGLISGQINRWIAECEPEEAYEKACEALMDVKGDEDDQSLKYMNEMLHSYTEDLERRFESEDEFDGQATGFQDIDERWNGMKPHNMIVVAARPSMGKTTLVMNMIENLVRQGQSWLFFSMEMSHDELIGKTISSAGKLSYTRLSNASLQDEDWSRLTSAVTCLKDGRLAVDDRGNMTIADMRARAYQVKAEFGQLDGIAVDYLQLMKGSGQSREAEIGGLSRALKSLAKEMGVPVIVISQLNRKCEERNNKRPILADLRDSGAIEQDANIVAFIYRDEVYNPETEVKGVAEINTAKFRGGKTGVDCLAWNGDYQRFDNLEYRPDVESLAEQQEQPQTRSRAF